MGVYLFYFVAFYNYARSLKQLADLGGRQPPAGLAPPPKVGHCPHCIVVVS